SCTKLVKYFMNKFNISISTAERLVYLKKEWYPLVFIYELLLLTKRQNIKFQIQDEIEFLKVSQPPVKIIKPPKYLSSNICKIIGAHTADGTLNNHYFSICDGYMENLIKFREWIMDEFNLFPKIRTISNKQWAISFNNKIFSRYLNKIFKYPSGCKQYTTGEPDIIKNSPNTYRKAFALGALTFEAGIGMKHQIEFCVASKKFRDDISNILYLFKIQHNCMVSKSSNYWRFWSNTLIKGEAFKWTNFFEPETEKWFKLIDYINGYSKEVSSFNEALIIFDKVYPKKTPSKVTLKDILLALRELRQTHRYELASYLANRLKLNSFGGKWAHSLKHYLDILKNANVILVKKGKFGKKKSFGSIIRDIYIFNEKIKEWRLPER
ncbi:hypothetical protein ACFL1H_07660, partial [Nanoarchaeota archaeon]